MQSPLVRVPGSRPPPHAHWLDSPPHLENRQGPEREGDGTGRHRESRTHGDPDSELSAPCSSHSSGSTHKVPPLRSVTRQKTE